MSGPSRASYLILVFLFQLFLLAAVWGFPGNLNLHRLERIQDTDTLNQKETSALGPVQTTFPHFPKFPKARVDRIPFSPRAVQQDHRLSVELEPFRSLDKRAGGNDKRPPDSDSDRENPPAKQPKNQHNAPSQLYADSVKRGIFSTQYFAFYSLGILGGWGLEQSVLPGDIKKVAIKSRNPKEVFDCLKDDVLLFLALLGKDEDVIRYPEEKCRPSDFTLPRISPEDSNPYLLKVDISLQNGYIGVDFGQMGAQSSNYFARRYLYAAGNIPIILYEGYNFWSSYSVINHPTPPQPLRHVSLFNIRNPDTIKIVAEALSRTNTDKNYMHIGSPAGIDTPEAETWNAVKDTHEIQACASMLRFHIAEFNYANIKNIFVLLKSDENQKDNSVSVILELEGLSGQPQRIKPGSAGDVSHVTQGLGDGVLGMVLKPTYDRVIKNGLKLEKELENAEKTARSMIQSGSGFGPLEHSSPFPENYAIGNSWAWGGSQVYPFKGLLETLTWQERSMTALEMVLDKMEDLELVFITKPIVVDEKSYRVVNLNEISGTRKSPITNLRLTTGSSAKNQHFSFRWPWETSVYQKYNLEDLLYHCWRIGSNNHREPSSVLDESKKLKSFKSIPLVPLKYITIWGVEEPITLIVLRLIYISRAGSGDRLREKLSLTFPEPGGNIDSYEKENWNAVVGTPAILPIAKMCQTYIVGLRACNIDAIHVSFHRPLSAPESGYKWTSNSVSVVVELKTSIEEKHLKIGSGQGTIRTDEDGDYEVDEDVNMAEGGSDPSRGSNLELPLGTFKSYSESTELGLSYAASEAIVENPLLSTLKERVQYVPSDNPSYTQIQASQTLPADKSYKILYNVAMSSQEQHLVLNDDISTGDADFAPAALDQSADEQFRMDIGKVLSTIWLSHKGWSQISRITFQTVDPGTLLTSEAAPDEANPIVSWENDGSQIWEENMNSFYYTLEGNAVGYLISKGVEFLPNPQIKAIHFGIHLDDPTKFFIYVDFIFDCSQTTHARRADCFGDRNPDALAISDDELACPRMFEPKSLLDEAFWNGVNIGAKMDTNYYTYAGHYVGPSYSYSGGKDRDHLSRYEFGSNEDNIDMSQSNTIIGYVKGSLEKQKKVWGTSLVNYMNTRVLQESYLSRSLHEKGDDKIRYIFATSPPFVGNLVLVSMDLLEEEGRADVDIVRHLSNAMYAEWTHRMLHVSRSIYPYVAVRLGHIGLTFFTVLQVLPRSALLLERIYQIYTDLFEEGTIILPRPSYDAKIVLSYAGHSYKGNVAVAKRLDRLWYCLLGLAEASALASMITDFEEQRDRTKSELKGITKIVIRRTGSPDGPGKFQLMFMIARFANFQKREMHNYKQKDVRSSYTALTYDFLNVAEAYSASLSERKLRLTCAKGLFATMLGSSLRGYTDEQINKELFYSQASAIEPAPEDPDILKLSDIRAVFYTVLRGKPDTKGSVKLSVPNMEIPPNSALEPRLFKISVRSRGENIPYDLIAGISTRSSYGFVTITEGVIILSIPTHLSLVYGSSAFRRQVEILSEALFIAWEKIRRLSISLEYIVIEPSKDIVDILRIALKPWSAADVGFESKTWGPRFFLVTFRPPTANGQYAALMPFSLVRGNIFKFVWEMFLSSLEGMAVAKMLLRFPKATTIEPKNPDDRIARIIRSIMIDLGSEESQPRIILRLGDGTLTVESKTDLEEQMKAPNRGGKGGGGEDGDKEGEDGEGEDGEGGDGEGEDGEGEGE
ncbi:hypothetical protein TWF481_006774 [Arthrobotrys musiformis]|uniref:Uncharacterized protein n=1 Tax=Arthrobotrys musiformis TaxID=47236 RepID=A0AAV9WBJ2_9PEZI